MQQGFLGEEKFERALNKPIPDFNVAAHCVMCDAHCCTRNWRGHLGAIGSCCQISLWWFHVLTVNWVGQVNDRFKVYRPCVRQVI